MYLNLKSVIATVACATLLAGTVMAQTPKKTTKPASAATKSAARPAASATPALTMTSTIDSVAYAIGVSVAGSLKSQGLSDINTALLMQAINETLKGGTTAMTAEQANKTIGEYFHKQTALKSGENQKIGQQFLEENKKRQGVTTTASGLQYEVLKMGEGPKPAATDRVRTHYHGTLVDGTVFDSSVERGEPVEFPVNGVIQGWQEALQLMPVGSKWKLYVPSELGYGERAAGPAIGPNSALVFEVELLEILK
ncbi:FKBP-type peptidyl-prolyl cis-trans isomerase [Telluribacter sp.]|jgi:FKBP-type peptidyl-prolyl cis-trans isomerase FklB|uniref:FKBP-type peptidyl-prolyl cis-trans isomerase n=1 Tax=Telluribacter sp. TaxID=1978767 RepID=UPI002E0FC8DA|nr:FKBP-type peptidyl-prolyl cis-trans isomerase [Telluribacter sp.]